MITVSIANRLRQRGLLLPISKEYDNIRVKEIAIRQWKLMQEMDELDMELASLQMEEEHFRQVLHLDKSEPHFGMGQKGMQKETE